MRDTSRNTERGRRAWLGNLALLAFTLLSLALIDRGLLAVLGRPIWEWDPVLHYRHRPGVEAKWEDVGHSRPIVDALRSLPVRRVVQALRFEGAAVLRYDLSRRLR